MPQAQELIQDLLKLAKAKGAETADALHIASTDLSVSLRLGALESLERSEETGVGLRVFIGQRQAIVSGSDCSAKALDELAARAVAMAKAAPEDPFCGIADASEIAATVPLIESADSAQPTAEQLIDRARIAEDAARAVPGVTNSEGSGAGYGEATVTMAASNGFSGTYRRTSYSQGIAVLAGTDTAMQRDHDSASRVFLSDMPEAASIGLKAAARAVKRVNPRKMPSASVPVFFDPRIAGGLIGSFLNAISGAAVARGTSFLKDKMGQAVFAPGITIIEDPLRPRGLRSRAFDSEGFLPSKRNLIDQGTLTTWLLDLRSARQLGLQSTGHASRGLSGPPSPSPSNVYVAPGAITPAELMQDVASGFYVTETMGMGINGVTGDYSQAASGFWIEKGEIAFPVSEVTIAGNLKDMFLHMSAANDLEFTRGIDAPTLRIEGMTVAGL